MHPRCEQHLVTKPVSFMVLGCTENSKTSPKSLAALIYARLTSIILSGPTRHYGSVGAFRHRRCRREPRVKEHLGLLGTSRLCRKDFEQAWFEPAKTFLLTLGAWDGSRPRYSQVLRKGVNLVLRLNFLCNMTGVCEPH